MVTVTIIYFTIIYSGFEGDDVARLAKRCLELVEKIAPASKGSDRIAENIGFCSRLFLLR